jgi:RNA polymerase sigma factor for flagellar operon FliA
MQARNLENEEKNLPAAVGKSADNRAEMLLKYAPLVKAIVARMRGRMPQHADIPELESAGMTGLLAAIERYDPARGYTFQTYAAVRIRGAILDELRHMDMVPRSVRLKQRLIARTTQALEQRLGRAPTDSELSGEMGLDTKSFQKLRMQARPVGIVYLDGEAPGEGGAMHECIADEESEAVQTRMEREELRELVARRIMEMPEQSRRVLTLYFVEGLNLAEIGAAMNLSEARICQIRSQGLEQLRRYARHMSAI